MNHQDFPILIILYLKKKIRYTYKYKIGLGEIIIEVKYNKKQRILEIFMDLCF